MRRRQASHAAGGERSLHARASHDGFRRLRRSLALAMVLPAMGVVALAPPAAATHQPPFEIDGNTPVDTTGNVDWATTGNRATDPSGNDDTTTFTEGSKEFNHPDTWVRGEGTEAPKTDITDVYTYTRTNHAGQVWGYFGFRRVANDGTVNYHVEFNQVPNYSSDPARPTRTPGDVMVRFEQDGNKGFELTVGYRWTLVSDPKWSDRTCEEVTGYTPAAGWCELTAAELAGLAFVGATGEDGHFAEGSLNLSALFGGRTCLPALTMNVRSIPGESLESELKDYVGPILLPPTCWKPIGITNVPRATYDVAYDWSVEKNVDNARQTVASGTNATFTYRVLLTAGDQQRSGNELGGTVTLTNPNGSPMVATLSVSATTGTGCTFPGVPDVSADAGLQVAVPAGSSSFVYTCTPASPPANGTSTATASWDSTTYPSGTEGSAYSATAGPTAYTWMLDQSTDEQTTVTDTFHTGAAQVLGTFTWAAVYNETDASTPPHTVVVATYTRTITAGAPGTCAPYVDTARQTENDTGQTNTSQETVTVCAAAVVVPPPPPPPEVLPEQAFGNLGGGLRATCQGTVRARMRNGTGDAARFVLRVNQRKVTFMVRSGKTRRAMTTAPARARVVLRAQGRVIDRLRVPAPCNPPEVLPDTGLRATTQG